MLSPYFCALGQTASTAFLKGTIPYSDVTTFCRHTRLLGADQQNAQIYPPIYPRWGIAFALVFGYTDSLEVLLIGVPANQQQYLNLRGAYCEECIVVVIWFFRHSIQAWGCQEPGTLRMERAR